jgi:hydrogenase maturation protein HypF
MAGFAMCGTCRSEYEDPENRRFHAQTLACADCGPTTELLRPDGGSEVSGIVAVASAADLIRGGSIIAVKGIGGFHLVADSANGKAITRLRALKQRQRKPFAVMFPSLDIASEYCILSAPEEELLCSAGAPIVLLRTREGTDIASAVAPDNLRTGAFLPYSPLHFLLLREVSRPLVVTSGNLSAEPLCFRNDDALLRLGPLCDALLMHDRRIVRPVDDSVARIVCGEPLFLRRARGFSPAYISLPKEAESVTAFGAEGKSTLTFVRRDEAIVSEELGNLESEVAADNFTEARVQLAALHGVSASAICHDLHPDYRSTVLAEEFARSGKVPLVAVQHHHAHVLACLAENGVSSPALGVCWDGTGYGPDGTVWGGEFLHVEGARWRRLAHLRRFPLPGGEAAVREPRRAALGILYAMYGGGLRDFADLPLFETFTAAELNTLMIMLQRKVHCPETSSAGRLFDAISALLGFCPVADFEGEAAIRLEAESERGERTASGYSFETRSSPDGTFEIDWSELVAGVIGDIRSTASSDHISQKFHNTLAEIVAAIAGRAGEQSVALCGGCFQNARLLSSAVETLIAKNFVPLRQKILSPNDASLSFGQAVYATLLQRP